MSDSMNSEVSWTDGEGERLKLRCFHIKSRDKVE
jgi:hypothetical protein